MENQYDIDVQVETAYVSEHSEPDEDRFVFAYTITLVNRGSVTAQLISRHWFITDADNRTEESKAKVSSVSNPCSSLGRVFAIRPGPSLKRPWAPCTVLTRWSLKTAERSTPQFLVLYFQRLAHFIDK